MNLRVSLGLFVFVPLIVCGCGGGSVAAPSGLSSNGPETTQSFDNIAGGDATAGSTVLPVDQISNQFIQSGLTVTSSGGFAAVVRSPNASSPPNALAATDTTGQVSYNAGDTIVFTFVDPKTHAPIGAVESFSAHVGGIPADSNLIIQFDGYDINGNVRSGAGGSGFDGTLTLNGLGYGLHKIVFTNRSGAPGVVIDDVKYSRVTDVNP